MPNKRSQSVSGAESLRLIELEGFDILDTEAEAQFDEIVELVAAICQTPIALITLVDKDRQWFKAKVGLDVCETGRDVAFCDHAIRQEGIFVIPDAAKDERFRENPLVTGAPYIRFYAGVPLRTHSGTSIGTLCIIDREPRTITDSQRRCLEILAHQVVAQIELRSKSSQLEIQCSELALVQASLQEKADKFQLAINAMHEGFVMQDSDGKIVQCNSRAWQILGLTEDQLLGSTSIDPAWCCVRADGSPFEGESHPVMVSLKEGIAQSNVPMGVYWASGNMVWININSAPLFRSGEDKPYGALCTFTDVTESLNNTRHIEHYLMTMSENALELEVQRQQLQEANARLETLASSDGLTGLFNHRTFQKDLLETLAISAPTSLLLIDVDHFKKYNDAFGHPAGDEVLQTVAAILRGAIRPQDLACRYGGEEFAIILKGTNNLQARKIGERILKALRGHSWKHRAVSASIGVATATGTGADKADLIDAADRAMYAAKHGGRDQVRSLPIEIVRKAG